MPSWPGPIAYTTTRECWPIQSLSACCDFHCTIDVGARVIRSVNPFRDPKFGIEKENNIRVRKLRSRPAILKPDRFKKRVNVLPTSSADKPQPSRNLFAVRDTRLTSLAYRWHNEREKNNTRNCRAIRRRASERRSSVDQRSRYTRLGSEYRSAGGQQENR